MLRKKSTSRIVLFALIGLIFVAGYAWHALSRPVNVGATVSVYIPRGASVKSIVDSLQQHISVPNPWFIEICSRIVLKFSSRTLQSGWIRIRPTDTQMDIVKGLFSSHRKPSIKVTFPEGLTYREMASIISRELKSDSSEFVNWCESDSVRAYYSIQSPTMEGYLKPDTYNFFFRESAQHIGDVLHRAFDELLDELNADLMNKFELDSVLTLASIVQAEAADVHEMPTIAGVYSNRLKRSMKLEADPTVQYGFGWKRRVLNKHVGTEHAYNTYVIFGLPPGPINNPGKKAIAAAISPQKHNYIFFVAKGDGSGQHRFSVTGAEHMQNVRKYRKSIN
ncbi:MAG: endolytic transglycosylase MltG [Ignavibacteria bacterium]|nr:endolytic transglycosylase MltG [Ignavibacteria bacterium]